MNAATQNAWTSYRDGRTVMHYMRASGGRYFVQKVEAGYSVTFLADEGDGVSTRLSTEATLAAGKKCAEECAARGFADTSLADIVAKFEDEPLYECEIPGAPGRVTYGQSTVGVSRGVAVELEAISEPATGRATRELPPGTHIATLEAVGLSPSGDIIASAVVHGFGSRCIQIVGRTHRIRTHRPRTYKPHTLGIDMFKVIRTTHFSTMLQCDRASDQDAYVCRIEVELMQYAGKKKTTERNKRVNRLVKILRRLKRGTYE